MPGEVSPSLVARSLLDLDRALELVPRKRGCVQCNSSSQLECPKCPDGQVCQYTIPVDCTQCAQTICMPDDTSPSPNNGGSGGGSSGPSAAPIVGGVIGGIAVIATLTFLVWRFLIRPKRSPMQQSMYEPASKTTRDIEKDNASRITHRSSTHTVHSIASTVLTRASNIIQIAYIPGVTNRATPTSPSVLVPPVPPIPMQHSGGSRASNQDDQHFFVPGNLRDSTYSGISEFSDRTSYAHRSSIASTIYGKQAQVQTPAQTGMRAKPTVVSVKSASASGAPITPPVPTIDFEKFGRGRPSSGASALSVGSTLVNVNTATQARAQVVKLGGGGPKKIDLGAKSEATVSSPLAMVSSPASSTHAQATKGLTIMGDSLVRDQGPFSDPPTTQKPAGVSTLGAVIEDEDEEHGYENEMSRRPGSSERGRSPFGDEHATKE